MPNFTGVITALVTPFKKGEIDFDSFKKLIRQQLDAGIEGFVINGTTGESPTLKSTEVEKLFSFAKSEVAGAVPLIVGTGSNSTEATVEATVKAEAWGADAALVVTPYYNKPPQRGLVAHFKKVAESSRLPVILYNVPGRSITEIQVETVKELSQVPNIIGIKEASGNLKTFKELQSQISTPFLFSSGDDPTCMEFVYLGGHGVISVLSHLIPGPIVKLVKRAREKDKSALEEFLGWMDLCKGIYCESNPIPVKMGLHLLGILESPELRLPLVTLADNHKADLKKLMSAKGLL